mmetsp:Transcript_6051/g.7411  ORF Transcript_6051/g.7411 Transcript_6051/m.7411 type:complete len:161 (-) Transcript_6051:254-736(-)
MLSLSNTFRCRYAFTTGAMTPFSFCLSILQLCWYDTLQEIPKHFGKIRQVFLGVNSAQNHLTLSTISCHNCSFVFHTISLSFKANAFGNYTDWVNQYTFTCRNIEQCPVAEVNAVILGDCKTQRLRFYKHEYSFEDVNKEAKTEKEIRQKCYRRKLQTDD